MEIGSSKKMKFDPDSYDAYSKEELIQIIHQLKCQISDQKRTESTPSVESNNSSANETRKNKEQRKFDFSKCRFRHIALKFLYLGWDYDGFVCHDGYNTIEYHIFNALSKACLIPDRNVMNYHRCGRTDKKVSSFSQVVSLSVRSRLLENETDDKELPYCRILNALLPKEIRIIAWAPVPNDFSARYSCQKRTYKYWFPRGNLDIEKMDTAIKTLIGVHDFRNLCKMDIKNGVIKFERNIYNASVLPHTSNLEGKNSTSKAYSMCEITISGSGFLWHQIRAIVTILFRIGEGKEDVDIFQKLLNINVCPRKPCYGLSNPVPLCLYDTEYADIKWYIDDDIIKEAKIVLQSQWTISAVQCSMLDSMLHDLSKISSKEFEEENCLHKTLLKDTNSKTYKPILSRPTEESLDYKISLQQKKGKLKGKEFLNDDTVNSH